MVSLRTKRRIFLAFAALALLGLIGNVAVFSGLSSQDVKDKLGDIRIPGRQKKPWHSDDRPADNPLEPQDAHPITLLMQEADKQWRKYEDERSTSFRQTVKTYRRKYGRHPPPGFVDWYKYARKRNVHNVDDFEQIMDDIRPFWGVEPRVIRTLAAEAWRDKDGGASGIHIRNHKIVKENNGSWRSETLVTLIKKFVKYLPDMDIAMNRLDQPRVVVPWEDMQAHLEKEKETRRTPPKTIDGFSTSMEGLLDTTTDVEPAEKEDPKWFSHAGKQYMELASLACPPESPARQPPSSDHTTAESTYKDRLGGLITNHNLSSDLCTIGPHLQDKHGLLYASSSMLATKRLVPIFGECKVNINSDILFPANMYYKHDPRYDYSPAHDLPWEDKADIMIWRGVTSGGTQVADNWQKMHRQRLVQTVNATQMAGKEVRILTEQPEKRGEYENYRSFHPSTFAAKHTDVGFTEKMGCIPEECPFYEFVFSWKNQVDIGDQFRNKILVDVDGHSFSGRWIAFLQSKSLGVKATIFREWHDSRLFAWRHFVPMDNRYDDIYTLLTYFLGVGTSPHERRQLGDEGAGAAQAGAEDAEGTNAAASEDAKAYVPPHDAEGKRLAEQGREWAKKVLRRDDIEIYMFRLLLEYGRIIDDNRDRIGYSGDGSELVWFDGVKDVGKEGG